MESEKATDLLALHCRAQAGNRKKDTTPAKTRVLREGRSGL